MQHLAKPVYVLECKEGCRKTDRTPTDGRVRDEGQGDFHNGPITSPVSSTSSQLQATLIGG